MRFVVYLQKGPCAGMAVYGKDTGFRIKSPINGIGTGRNDGHPQISLSPPFPKGDWSLNNNRRDPIGPRPPPKAFGDRPRPKDCWGRLRPQGVRHHSNRAIIWQGGKFVNASERQVEVKAEVEKNTQPHHQPPPPPQSGRKSTGPSYPRALPWAIQLAGLQPARRNRGAVPWPWIPAPGVELAGEGSAGMMKSKAARTRVSPLNTLP